MRYLMYSILIIATMFTFCNKSTPELKIFTVNEIFQTERNEMDNIDSPAIWHGLEDQHWLIATAKSGHALVVNDATNGDFIARIGEKGIALGQFSRPNGIFVINDLLLVVERDNHRVQVMTLPEFSPLGTIGDSLLVKPYGLFVYQVRENVYSMYVTDNYKTEIEDIPPDEALDKSIHHYEFSVQENEFSWMLLNQFGATRGEGVLSIVESIWGDVVNDYLLIAEEDVRQSSVKVYDFAGQFTGSVFGQGLFDNQVEGISLYKTDPGEGYWIVTDQSYEKNRYHLFERKSFEYVATFQGPKTTNTDGIWLSARPFGDFPEGAFYAVHDDGNVSAFDWQMILETTGIAK